MSRTASCTCTCRFLLYFKDRLKLSTPDVRSLFVCRNGSAGSVGEFKPRSTLLVVRLIEGLQTLSGCARLVSAVDICRSPNKRIIAQVFALEPREAELAWATDKRQYAKWRLSASATSSVVNGSFSTKQYRELGSGVMAVSRRIDLVAGTRRTFLLLFCRAASHRSWSLSCRVAPLSLVEPPCWSFFVAVLWPSSKHCTIVRVLLVQAWMMNGGLLPVRGRIPVSQFNRRLLAYRQASRCPPHVWLKPGAGLKIALTEARVECCLCRRSLAG